jgi:hypothetical protein
MPEVLDRGEALGERLGHSTIDATLNTYSHVSAKGPTVSVERSEMNGESRAGFRAAEKCRCIDMSPIVLTALIGGALLVILTPLAIRQRRGSSAVASPLQPEASAAMSTWAAPPPPMPAPTGKATTRSLTSGQIALGVFLGLWMFVVSVGVPTFFVVDALSKRWRGH